LEKKADSSDRAADEADEYDPLDQALIETFPASDPIAVSQPESWPRPSTGGIARP
jgi:hypothetical protein